MRVIHVLRKALSEGTVAANTTKHGVGGLNIDASRINLNNEELPERKGGYSDSPVYGTGASGYRYTQPTGRWPANLILQHLDGCRCLGVKRVKAITGGMKPGSTGAFGKNGVYGTAEGLQNKVEYGGVDGKETVANWICEPGCPVAGLDEQSGEVKSGISVRSKGTVNDGGTLKFGGFGQMAPGTPNAGYSDNGGASRFFKQVGGKKDA